MINLSHVYWFGIFRDLNLFFFWTILLFKLYLLGFLAVSMEGNEVRIAAIKKLETVTSNRRYAFESSSSSPSSRLSALQMLYWAQISKLGTWVHLPKIARICLSSFQSSKEPIVRRIGLSKPVDGKPFFIIGCPILRKLYEIYCISKHCYCRSRLFFNEK